MSNNENIEHTIQIGSRPTVQDWRTAGFVPFHLVSLAADALSSK